MVALADGTDIVVIYNPNMPGSREVAEHYAAARKVPASQVFALPSATNDVISRKEFIRDLQQPLAEKLESARLWRFGKVKIPAANGQPAHTETRVIESKVRYAVLCYGVPLKIASTPVIDDASTRNIPKEFRLTEAAVDSELVWLPLSRNDVALVGPLPNPYYSTTNRFLLNCTNGVLLIARLDGATPEIARGLVDKAMEAERNGFWGRAYFDTRGLSAGNTNYIVGDNWLKTSAEICRLQGFDVEVDTNESTLPASFPMSHAIFYAGWYTPWVDGPLKNISFMPGAFAYHLHSFNAESLRYTNQNWCGALLARNTTCTMGTVYEPYLILTPNIAFFTQAFFSGWTFGEAAWASQIAVSWQTTVIGDPLYQPINKTPPELHAYLESQKSPLLEWSYERLVNFQSAHGTRPFQIAAQLENNPLTSQSAILSEKLAEIYEQQGKPGSAIDTWQRALKLSRSEDQQIRIRLILTEKLRSAGRTEDALANDRQFIAEHPNYAGLPAIRKAMETLEREAQSLKN